MFLGDIVCIQGCTLRVYVGPDSFRTLLIIDPFVGKSPFMSNCDYMCSTEAKKVDFNPLHSTNPPPSSQYINVRPCVSTTLLYVLLVYFIEMCR